MLLLTNARESMSNFTIQITVIIESDKTDDDHNWWRLGKVDQKTVEQEGKNEEVQHVLISLLIFFLFDVSTFFCCYFSKAGP